MALVMALREAGLAVECQVPVPVWFRRQKVGDFRADILVEKKVLLELKSSRAIDPAHEAQLLHYLKRSEEHTSELQSRLHLVCRLLLEKKKNKSKPRIRMQLFCSRMAATKT